ncbi:CPBP family intramembrane metalloprotease [Ruminococcaceae bacterium OttesenSCG-928-I18]|nr:CPBP family intramembrane metalloprotease [Ruminococcaceae bacterium OttesenSCG-928-I18]
MGRDKHFFRIENPSDDFPYYNGKPVSVGLFGWVIILAFLVLSFLSLRLHGLLNFLPDAASKSIAVFVMLALSALGLILVTRKHWVCIFRKFHARNIKTVLLCLVASYVLSFVAAKLVALVAPTSANPQAVASHSGVPAFLFSLFQDLFQLMGEEFLAILPFLAILQLGYTVFKWSRKTSIVVATIASCVLFGLLHLPTYNWNWMQCIFAIGLARLPFTLGYIATKNIFVSFLIHYLFDSLIFIFMFALSSYVDLSTVLPA